MIKLPIYIFMPIYIFYHPPKLRIRLRGGARQHVWHALVVHEAEVLQLGA